MPFPLSPIEIASRSTDSTLDGVRRCRFLVFFFTALFPYGRPSHDIAARAWTFSGNTVSRRAFFENRSGLPPCKGPLNVVHPPLGRPFFFLRHGSWVQISWFFEVFASELRGTASTRTGLADNPPPPTHPQNTKKPPNPPTQTTPKPQKTNQIARWTLVFIFCECLPATLVTSCCDLTPSPRGKAVLSLLNF